MTTYLVFCNTAKTATPLTELFVQRNDEDSASKSESKVEAEGELFLKIRQFLHKQEKLFKWLPHLSDNNVTEKKEQGEVAQKKSVNIIEGNLSNIDDLNARLESHELNARFTVDEEKQSFPLLFN